MVQACFADRLRVAARLETVNRHGDQYKTADTDTGDTDTMTTETFLRFEFRKPGDTSDFAWQHWADEPASQVITEMREASEDGKYDVRALDADGTVVAELRTP